MRVCPEPRDRGLRWLAEWSMLLAALGLLVLYGVRGQWGFTTAFLRSLLGG